MFAPRTTNGQPHLPPELAAHSLAASAAASLAPPPHRRLRKSDNDLQQHQRSRSRSPTAASDSSTSSSSSSKAASWRSGGKRRTFSMRDLLHRASDHSSTSALLAASLFPSTPSSSSSSSGGSGDENAASGADLGWTSSSPDASPPQLRRRDKLKAFLRASGEEHSHRRRSEDGEEGEGVERKHHHRHRRHREEDSRLEVDDDEDRHHRHRHLRKHLVPQRCPTESSLCQARAPLITIDDASPLSSPDAHATRSYRPQRPPLGIDDGDHQSGPTPHLAFAGPLAEGAAAAAVMSVANATTTRPHARISGAADDHHHQHQQQPPRTHAALARSESAPALPPVTPAHSSLAAIERAFPGSAASAQHEHHPLPPLSEAADEGLQGAGEKRRNRMARVREKRGADKSASHAVLYFPDRAGDESVIREFDRSHWHHEHLHHLHLHQQHNQEPSAPVKEAKAVAYNPFEAAHFPPPRLYGSSRLSMALPPGSPAPPPADVDHSRMTREEGSTKTDEEERLPDFPFPVSPVDTWSLIRSVQQLYYDGHTVINQDTIIGRKLYNFRDLSEATRNARHGVKLASQRIFRSACLSRGDVDHVDVVKSLIYLKDFVKIKTMIDFRNKDERMSDPLDAVVDAVYPRIKKGALVEPSSCRRYNIPLMNKSFKIMGLFLPSKWGTKMNMVKAVVYGSEKTPTEIFAEEAMNPMGLLGLNKLMLVYGKEEIAQVLRICANSSNHPIMYHCSSGKDRTGLITALILLCCGVDAQDIIANYHESEIFLSPVMDRITAENQAKGLNAGFDGTPPEVMEQTIDYIFEKWGSITGYFSYCGFGNRDQMKLVQHLGHHLRK